MIPNYVELFVFIGVRCWGCPISSNVFLISSPSFELINRPPNSASAADAMIFFRISETTNTDPLCFVGEIGSKWSLRKKFLPTLLPKLDTDKYDALLWMCN